MNHRGLKLILSVIRLPDWLGSTERRCSQTQQLSIGDRSWNRIPGPTLTSVRSS